MAAEPAPVTSLDDRRPPRVRVEPPTPAASSVRKVLHAQSIIRSFRGGQFGPAALLVEDALGSASVRAAVETRLAGLIATGIRWEPASETPDARRACDAIKKDWPFILSESTRRQRHQWGLFLGVGPSQKHWYQSRSTGRAIPRVQLYHPYWFSWNAIERAYQVQVQNDAPVFVPSPALGPPEGDFSSAWVIHEPFGKDSYRSGYVVSVWDAWLRVVWACRDMARGSAKHALGAYKIVYPHGVDKNAVADFLAALRVVESEGQIPCEDFGPEGKFDVLPLEFTAANTFQLSRSTKDVADSDIARLLLGMTSVSKDGNYGAATARELVRDDLKMFDAASEMTTDRPQVLMPWAEANFGDPDLAPVAIYETDPPAVNQAAAQTLAALSQALVALVKVAPWVDVEALLARFRVPQQAREDIKRQLVEAQGQTTTATPGTTTAPTADPAAPTDATAEATFQLTPSDLASIVRVNEARRSIGQPPVDGEIGALWVREHAARLGATLPPPTDAPPGDGGPPADSGEQALARLAAELEPLARSNPGAAHRALGGVLDMIGAGAAHHVSAEERLHMVSTAIVDMRKGGAQVSDETRAVADSVVAELLRAVEREKATL